MYNFKIGDLIGKNIDNKIVKIGVIIEEKEKHFIVKWISYNKSFFLEDEDNKKKNEIFNELNKLYLLSYQSINRDNKGAFLTLLSSS